MVGSGLHLAIERKLDRAIEPTQASEFLWDSAELACSSEWILPAVKREIRHLPAGSVVADLGCGNGSLLSHLRDYRFRLYGLDSSTSGLQQAKRAFPDINFSEADLTSDLSSHSLAGKCDAVISTEVVEHVFFPRMLAKNCYRMLKPGGILIVSTPYHGYVKNLALAVTGKLDAHFTALWDCGHIKFWSRHTLTTLLQEAGFVVEHFRGVGRVPLLWKTMILVGRRF